MKRLGMLVILPGGINQGFWSHFPLALLAEFFFLSRWEPVRRLGLAKGAHDKMPLF